MCAKFRAKQTKFEILYARKCQKSFKTLKIATWHVISNIWLWFSILTTYTQYYIPNSAFWQVSYKTNQVWDSLCAKVTKRLKNPKNHSLACKFWHMTMIFTSNHFNTIVYSKQCCVLKCRNKQTKFGIPFALKCQKSFKNP